MNIKRLQEGKRAASFLHGQALKTKILKSFLIFPFARTNSTFLETDSSFRRYCRTTPSKDILKAQAVCSKRNYQMHLPHVLQHTANKECNDPSETLHYEIHQNDHTIWKTHYSRKIHSNIPRHLWNYLSQVLAIHTKLIWQIRRASKRYSEFRHFPKMCINMWRPQTNSPYTQGLKNCSPHKFCSMVFKV